jgi:hypothetical protein
VPKPSQSHLAQRHHDTALPLLGQHLPYRRRRAFAHRGIQANAPGRSALGIQPSVIRRIPSIYQRCSQWRIELFFKWVKQNLRIKHFYGTSENAVKTQIWIAVSVYVLVAIIKKELELEISLYTFLQILSVRPFEKLPLSCAFLDGHDSFSMPASSNQLNLFES